MGNGWKATFLVNFSSNQKSKTYCWKQIVPKEYPDGFSFHPFKTAFWNKKGPSNGVEVLCRRWAFVLGECIVEWGFSARFPALSEHKSTTFGAHQLDTIAGAFFVLKSSFEWVEAEPRRAQNHLRRTLILLFWLLLAFQPSNSFLYLVISYMLSSVHLSFANTLRQLLLQLRVLSLVFFTFFGFRLACIFLLFFSGSTIAGDTIAGAFFMF